MKRLLWPLIAMLVVGSILLVFWAISQTAGSRQASGIPSVTPASQSSPTDATGLVPDTSQSDGATTSPASGTPARTLTASGVTSGRSIFVTITSPASGTTVSTGKIKISGKTLSGAEVFVNESEARADASGNFSVVMNLDDGENYFIIFANDADGNAAEQELTVNYVGS